ncbi:MAG: hypothetical protein FWE23_05760 [Chitinivibrionia bacterium]|nr:hypothetical protein [Chitinivibrionia bacterium]
MLKRIFILAISLISCLWAQAPVWTANDITLRTAADLTELSRRVRSNNATERRDGFANVNITLAANINLNGSQSNQWTPIGTAERPFQGNFNGGEHTVDGIFIRTSPLDPNHGFFGVVGDFARITNINVNADVLSSGVLGGLVGTNNGIIENSSASGKIATSGMGTGSVIGGLAGLNNGIISAGSFEGEITANGNWRGGLIGMNFGFIKNSEADATISTDNSTTGSAGSFVYFNGGRIADSKIKGQNQIVFAGRNDGLIVGEICDGCDPSPIRDRNPAINSRYGIILENAVVSDIAKITVITPEPATINIRILDALGNQVFNIVEARHSPQQTAVWNLINNNGRLVASGTYLITVEATGVSGRRFTYSTRIGVRR